MSVQSHAAIVGSLRAIAVAGSAIARIAIWACDAGTEAGKQLAALAIDAHLIVLALYSLAGIGGLPYGERRGRRQRRQRDAFAALADIPLGAHHPIAWIQLPPALRPIRVHKT